MRSLRSRLLAGAILGTTIAFAVGGVLVHRLIAIRLASETDTSLAQTLDFAVERLAQEFRWRNDVRGEPVRPGDQVLFNPTGREDTLYVCRTLPGVLVDASEALGEASAVIDLPEAGADEPVFGDFVLADGAPARGAAITFRPERRGARRGPPFRGPRPDGPPREEGGGRDDRERDAEAGAPLRLIVLQSVAARDESLRHLALVLGSTWLFTCVLGSGALWLTIRRGLRPLEELRLRIADLDWRSMSAPVSVAGAPKELAPVVAQLEASRQRIASAFRRERRFVGDAAHELRTPVSGIKAILEVALRRERSNEELKASAKECLAIASEMGRAVEALLTLGKLSRGEVALELADVDLAVLAEEAWKPLAVAARERGVTLEVGGDARPVTANRDLLLRALANLVDNAVDYGVAPGVVRVTHVRGDAQSVIEVTNAVTEVPSGFEEHAFEPFWRGDAARTDAMRHAGLGLALVNQIAELHGGTATITARDSQVVARIVIPDA